MRLARRRLPSSCVIVRQWVDACRQLLAVMDDLRGSFRSQVSRGWRWVIFPTLLLLTPLAISAGKPAIALQEYFLTVLP